MHRTVKARSMRHITAWEREDSALSTNEGDMKKTVLGSAVAVAWCVAVPMAQQPTAPTPSTAPAHNVFVVSGCLMPGAEASGSFKLTDATPIERSARRGATETAIGTTGQKPSYEL